MVRRRIIESILATDMANHSKHLAQLNAKLDALEIDNGKNIEKLICDNVSKNYENQQAALNLIIHSADISNPAKPLKVYNNWVKLVFNEFFNQGDLEKKNNLPVSMLCDRESTNINKSQIGFIKFIVKPTFDCIIKIIPLIKEGYFENIIINTEYYNQLILKEEEEIKEKNLNK